MLALAALVTGIVAAKVAVDPDALREVLDALAEALTTEQPAAPAGN